METTLATEYWPEYFGALQASALSRLPRFLALGADVWVALDEPIAGGWE